MIKTLGVYSYVTRAMQYDIPVVEMIKSVAPFSDNIHIVVDEIFEDGTLETLRNLQADVSKLVVHPIKFDWNNPAIDGVMKATARDFCKDDIKMSMDGDEIVRPVDVPKIKKLKQVYPDNNSIIGTGIINWFNGKHIKLNAAGAVKERFTTSASDVTHGIPITFRIPVVGTAYIRALPDSDGAGYIDNNGNPVVPNIFLCKGNDPRKDITNPESIWIHHMSYWSLPRKWEMKKNWHLMWGQLYGKVENLEDYQNRNNPDGEPVDFYSPPIIKPHESYFEPIRDEMNKKDAKIVKVRNISIPGLLKKWADRQRVFIPRRFPFKDININMKTNSFSLGM